MKHDPVLLQEVLTGLNLQAGETVLDATLNRAGHAVELAKQVGKTGTVVGIDADKNAIAEAKINLEKANTGAKIILLNSNFRNLAELLEQAGINKLDAALFDLGLSSQQLEESGRGFSFQKLDEKLLMSFSENPELTASEVVNHWREETLSDVIYAYGEERFAKRIAREIVAQRQNKKIETVADLLEIIRNAVPAWYRSKARKLHFATKTFQALRIVVNDELGALKAGLDAVWQKLDEKNGRLAVISFHSLEAKIVKDFYKAKAEENSGEILTKHAVKPARAETLQNPRSRSAQLRIIKKI
ncbi:MAG: 16S rRNA (cytosine(1402)-N(4))-methyltransferase RsmH [Patescibacteria group bacterium]